MVDWIRTNLCLDGRRAQSWTVGNLVKRGAGHTVLFLFALLLVSSGLAALPASANAGDAFAAIVIRPGDGTVTYAYVPLDEPVTGIELLRRSGVSLVTVSFGGLGEGVCKIEQTGCDVGSCRTRMCQTGDRESPYWRYFQADQTGEWVASPLGGSGTKVAPGEVDGWSWTPTDPQLPQVDIAAIPALAGAEGALDQPHFARYDANGVLMHERGTVDVPWRSYVMVGIVLVGVALFGAILRWRSRKLS